MWKLCILPNTSKSPRALQLLFVHCLHRTFWFQLLKGCCRFYSPSDKLRQPINYADIDRLEVELTEHLKLPIRQDLLENDQIEEITQNGHKTHEDSKQNVMMLKDKLLHKSEELETWTAVAVGINRMVNSVYMLGNVLVFSLYLCPLLYRIIVHSVVSDYFVEID